ncbi:MAG: type IV toxin-antitoxin system AbiEi family antitoxin domain-containing protein [Gemmatimonadota bacterium]|nr:MAG: type IV toxin-antitoxin system AbiEi family antitoxin domain-containing protein [Gemmatimonadota bacterium]
MPDRQQLFQIASQQGGHFTAAQALTCAYSRALVSHHAKTGQFVRVHRGVYRLRDYPSSPRGDVVAAWLAAGPEVAVVSHETALELLDLSDVIPDSIHITLPRRRRWYRPPPGVTVHTTDRPPGEGEIVRRLGMRVTGPARSILDAADWGTEPGQIEKAVRDAVDRAMTTASELREGAGARPARVRRLVERALRRSEES